MTTVLAVEAVSKQFRLQHNRPMTLKESAIRWLTRRNQKSTAHWALHNVTFSVEQGQALGIVGHNGAGKSTLLRLLCGLGRPTSGRIRRNGHVSGLLDLGSGFHPDLTGRENIMTGGLLSGLTKREVLQKQDEIIAFAELEEYIDEPVRTYSSGMYLRMAFATAMQFNPAVLVIDEVLAVGDARFQQKCLQRLAAFRAAGKTLILTSHVPEQIQALCDEVLVLEEGQVAMHGDPERAITCYTDLMRQRTERRAAEVLAAAAPATLAVAEGSRQGTQEATIDGVQLFDASGSAADTLRSGGSLTIELSYRLNTPMPDITLSLGIYSESHIKCFESIIPSLSATFGPLANRGSLRCHIPELPLLEGCYYINVGLYPPDWSYIFDYHWQMHPIYIIGQDEAAAEVSGVVSLRSDWSASSQIE